MVQKGNEGKGLSHTVVLSERKNVVIEGVREVVRFDDCSVLMSTVQGALNVEGEELHIRTLSLETGHVEIEGKIDAAYYEDKTEKSSRGFFSRLVH